MRAFILLAILIGSACACSGHSPPGDSQSASSMPSQVSAGTSDWKSFGSGTPQEEGYVNGAYRAEVKDFGSGLGLGKTTTKVFDDRSRLVLLHTTPGHGWFNQQVWLTEHFAVIEEINDPRLMIRIVAYDLLSGKRLVMPRPLITQPELDASNGEVAYISGHSDGRMCVQVLDLASMQARQATCARRGQVLSDVAYNAGRVAYSVIDRPNQKSRCKTVWVFGAGAEPQALPMQQKCLGWSGAVMKDGLAWDEANPLQANLPSGRGYLQSPDGAIHRTGLMVDTDSMVGCGDHVYWSDSDERGPRIDATDTDGHVTTVWGPDKDWVPGLLSCADDRLLQMSLGYVGVGIRPDRFVVLDAKPGR